MDQGGQNLEEILRLTKDNNRMLHAMRRNAFLGGILKIIFYVLIFIIAPLWIYSTYLQPVVQSMIQTYNQMQSTGTRAQNQFFSLGTALKDLESKLPAFMQGKQ